MDATVGGPGDEQVVSDRDNGCHRRVACERAEADACLEIPESHRPIVRSRDRAPAIGKHRNATDPMGVPVETAPLSPGLEIPCLDQPVGEARKSALAVAVIWPALSRRFCRRSDGATRYPHRDSIAEASRPRSPTRRGGRQGTSRPLPAPPGNRFDNCRASSPDTPTGFGASGTYSYARIESML